MTDRVAGVPIRRNRPAPLPGFEAVNDLGISIRAEQMRELRESCQDLIRLVRIMRDGKSSMCIAADRVERAITAIPATI